jgi:hypothetical protein
MSDAALYSRLLHTKKQGCALFSPQPSNDLPRAEREIGIRVGHVGIVTEDGGFDPIFNILDRAEDNPSGVPQGFEQVVLRHDAILHQWNCHRPGSDISNTTVNKKRLGVDFGVESNVYVIFVEHTCRCCLTIVTKVCASRGRRSRRSFNEFKGNGDPAAARWGLPMELARQASIPRLCAETCTELVRVFSIVHSSCSSCW